MRLQTWTSAASVESITESTTGKFGAGQTGKLLLPHWMESESLFLLLCIECVRSINRIFNSWTINPCAADLDFGVIYSSFIHPQGTHWHAAFQSLLCTVTSILIKLERWSPQSLSLNWTHPAAWLSIFIQTTQSANKRKIIHTICFMRALFSPFFGKNEIHLKVRASSEAPIFLRCRWWRLSSSLYLL